MNRKNAFFIILLFVLIGIPVLGMVGSRDVILPAGISARPEFAPAVAEYSMGTAAVAPAPDMAMTRDMAAGNTGFAAGKMTMMPMPPQDGFVAGEDRAIIRTASLTAVVEDVRKSVDEVTNLTKAINGYVTSSNISDGDYQQNELSAYLTLRVPADKLDETIGKIRDLAIQVTNETTNASDQTKQKMDIEAQLRNQKATEEQLMTIMKQAKTVTETLQVQQQLTSVRQQIEMLEAQQQNLTTNVAMATLNVQLRTKAADVTYKQDSLVDELKLAVRDAGQMYRRLFISGIRNVIFLGPLAIFGLIIWAIWKKRQPKTK